MTEEERYEVVGSSAVQLTLADGTVASVPPGHDPVEVQKDRRFKRAKADGDIRKTYVEIEEEADDDGPVGGVTEDAIDAIEGGGVLEDDGGGAGEPDFDRRVDELGLADRIEDALFGADLDTVGDVLDYGLGDITEINDIGESSKESIEEALETGDYI